MSTAVESAQATGLEARLSSNHGNGPSNGHSNGQSSARYGASFDGFNGYAADPHVASLRLEDKIRAQKIEARLSDMVLSLPTLRRVGAVFERELEAGLRERPSSLQMENTYIPELPDGTEEGMFLALDLGGTNFRVLLLELKDGKLLREDVHQYHISDALRLGPGEDLFNFLADCVHDFVCSEGMEKEELSLGFTFSFPMKQHSIASGELITWTKSFKCDGMQGVDVAALLQRCLRARGLRVAVRVLLNDTTGTLMAGAMRDPNVGIGVILGTGSNGCYVERAERVQHWENAGGAGGAGHVCVDVEWGAFGDNGCIDFVRTDVDREVDAGSLLATSFTFEKYIGGKYLGEILRASLSALARDRLFPVDLSPESLTTADLSAIEEDRLAGSLSRTRAVLEAAAGAGAARLAAADAAVAQYVARIVSDRAAQLVSVCIAALLRRMDRPYVVVAVDGSVYKRHPRMRSLMRHHITALAPNHAFSLMEAEDGSGKGSALTAAIAARIAARRD